MDRVIMDRGVMASTARSARGRVARRREMAALGIVVCLLTGAFAAFAQNAATDPQGHDDGSAPPRNDASRPGFIDAFGHLVGDSAAQFNTQLGGARDALGELGRKTGDAAKNAVGAASKAVDAAKETAGQVVGLPNMRFADGHERCATTTNGAADCQAAAVAICRAKGFATGKLLDTQSLQKCPARVWLSGHLPGDGDCASETFATRAVCQ